MKLLILGGTGFIGKNLKEAFSEKTNYSVLVQLGKSLTFIMTKIAVTI